jgi:propionate CoA-transferase
VDAAGNVNVSRFNGRIIGVGGFINISQCAKKVIFSGTFTAGNLEMNWPEGKTVIQKEGKHKKFPIVVEQVSYSGPFAEERGQEAIYITERAVFRRAKEGLELIEVAPGIDLDRDILANMEFRPGISSDLKLMDARLFLDKPMGLAADLTTKQPVNIPKRLQE